MQATRRPHYWPEDSLHLFNRADGPFHLQLSDKKILAALGSLRAGAQGYEKHLPHYPTILCAPLDLLYLFRRASCTLDEELLQDLLFSYSWREAHWGAWLAALAPSTRYTAHLQNRKPTLPHGDTVSHLALGSCRGDTPPAGLEAHWALLCEIRELVAQLPALFSPLRRNPNAEEEKTLQSETESMRKAYRQGGLAAAAKTMGPLLSFYGRNHLAWARSAEGRGA